MSDAIITQHFNMSKLILRIYFVGDDFETASVQFKLEDAISGRGVLEKSVTIPVKCVFDMSHLIGMCLRRTALQYEVEVQDMVDRLEIKKHPFKKKENKNGTEEDKAK